MQNVNRRLISRSLVLRSLGVGLFVVFGIPQLAAANDTHAEAVRILARRARVASMMGNQALKEELLQEALEVAPLNPHANYAAGRVRLGKEWVSTAEYEQKMQENSLLQAYQLQRQELSEGRINELALADWCREKGLFDRERLHLANLWRSESIPENAKGELASRLRLQNVGGIWLSPEEFVAMQASVRTAQQNAAKWRPATMTLIRSLKSSKNKTRQAAIDQYRSQVDSTAIVSIESLLSNLSEPFGLLAVRLIAEVDGFEATESLVRHAILASTENVRNAAVAKLRERELHDAVPLLLAQLSNPLEAGFAVGVGVDGMVRTAQQVVERGRDANVRYINTNARGIHRLNGAHVSVDGRGRASVVNADDLFVQRRLSQLNLDDFEDRLEAEATLRNLLWRRRQALMRQEVMRAIGTQRSLQFRNQRRSVINERAIEALVGVTGESLKPATASTWWDWWNAENDRYQSEAPTYTRYVSTSDPVRLTVARTCECFPAGTLVRTQTGHQPIESIQVGDRVLSRDTETGQLDYKLIRATTLRPETSMVTVRYEGGVVDATDGHLFWVEEQGWRMAKNLKPGDLIHGLDQARKVESVVARQAAKAHNLVVADFGNYFVTDQDVLVHDNTERRRSNCISPGVPKVAWR